MTTEYGGRPCSIAERLRLARIRSSGPTAAVTRRAAPPSPPARQAITAALAPRSDQSGDRSKNWRSTRSVPAGSSR